MSSEHPRMPATAKSQRDERAAIAIRDDVVRVTRGRPTRWVAVHEVAERLGLPNDVVELAVRRAIDSGWVVGDGEPPHSVRLTHDAGESALMPLPSTSPSYGRRDGP